MAIWRFAAVGTFCLTRDTGTGGVGGELGCLDGKGDVLTGCCKGYTAQRRATRLAVLGEIFVRRGKQWGSNDMVRWAAYRGVAKYLHGVPLRVKHLYVACSCIKVHTWIVKTTGHPYVWLHYEDGALPFLSNGSFIGASSTSGYLSLTVNTNTFGQW